MDGSLVFCVISFIQSCMLYKKTMYEEISKILYKKCYKRKVYNRDERGRNKWSNIILYEETIRIYSRKKRSKKKKLISRNLSHSISLLTVCDLRIGNTNLCRRKCLRFQLSQASQVWSFQDVQRAASPWCTLGIRSCRTFCSDLAW